MTKKTSRKSLLGNTLLVLLIALVAMTAVTYAWFSISDNARLSMMRMDVTTGPSLRMDLVPHATFEEYKRTLTFREIADKIKADTGGVKSRCIPFEEEHFSDVCVCCGKPALHHVVWGRQY